MGNISSIGTISDLLSMLNNNMPTRSAYSESNQYNAYSHVQTGVLHMTAVNVNRKPERNLDFKLFCGNMVSLK